jgi:ectoine hydroxylase-related dioxygenase (phytanoyl-CoA dioxygenase family)
LLEDAKLEEFPDVANNLEHTKRFVHERWRDTFVHNKNFRGQNYEVDPECLVQVQPGDAVFFHGFTLHRARAHLGDQDPR